MADVITQGYSQNYRNSAIYGHDESSALTPNERGQLTDLIERLDRVTDDEIQEAIEQAHREDPKSGLRKINALITAIHAALTDVSIFMADNQTGMRNTQRSDYSHQQAAYKRKAFLALIGVAGGALMIVSAFRVSDGVKTAMEALSKVPGPISSTLTTIQDGKIQGENTYDIREIEGDMEQNRATNQKGDAIDRMVSDTASSMRQLLSRLSSACIGANG